MTPVHRAALDGFSQEARAYARGRPGYPDALVEWLCGPLRLGPGKTAVDLGAGTGKFTRLMLRTGAKVVAVEPVDAMREQLVESLPGVTVVPGAAESIPTPYEADAPRFHTGQWRQAFTGDLFSEPQSFAFQYQHVGTPQETIIDRSLSVSFIAALPAPEKARVRGRLETLIDTWPQLQGRTEIAFPYQTRAYRCVRR